MPSISSWEPFQASDPKATRRLPPQGVPPRRLRPLRSVWSTLGQGILLGVMGALLLILLGVGVGLGIYGVYAASLPSPDELHDRAAAFKSAKIHDRRGRLLFEVFDPTGGRRTLVRIEEVPGHLIDAVVATEDETFFVNPGLNPFAILRALLADLREGEIVQGGSTITQQVVKNLFLTPERTLSRKVNEAILAAELTRRYSKNEILEIYLNEVYYGNLAYGMGAASETYFGKHVSRLTLPEAALLAGLIQSPALYDPYTHPQAALARRAVVLRRMRESGLITAAQEREASAAPLDLVPREVVMEAPHMVMYVREELERQYGTEALYGGGLQVYTTLELALQHQVEEIVRQQMAELSERGASNAAVVVMDPRTGDILAMVGSVDFYRPGDGQVNVARRLRQPGSTIKPFTYLAALERGWTPGTMLMDVRQAFPDGANPPYTPENYDKKEMGPISLRTALACSRNIPAVSTLHQIGLPALLDMSHRLGMVSLNRPDYGLALTLGGGDVTLLEMVAAYGALANGGQRVTTRPVLRIVDQQGAVWLDQDPPAMPQVVDPRHAYLISHILADNEARVPAFGRGSVLEWRSDRPSPVAVKTGTTDDYRDSWTVGYTPEVVVGVWVGNNDNTPMDRLTGSRGAALIWREVMELALEGQEHDEWPRPDGLVELEVCALSGQRPGPHCTETRHELFLADHLPEECTVHRVVQVCQITGALAAEHCPKDTVEERVVEDYGPSWDGWAQAQGIDIPPRESCTLHQRPVHVALRVAEQSEGRSIAGILRLVGSTDIPDFAAYWVEVGRGEQPSHWTPVTPPIAAPVMDSTLCNWDSARVEPGLYTLRLVVSDQHGHRYQATTTASIERMATPTPSISPTPLPSLTPTALPKTPTPISTATPTSAPPTWTPSPVSTATSTSVSPTWTPSPVNTATSTTAPPTWTPVNTAAPTATWTLPPSPTPTPSLTPTDRPTATASPTALPTATLTAVPTVEATSTVTAPETVTPVSAYPEGGEWAITRSPQE
jgi:1A family penicillin-binding protein